MGGGGGESERCEGVMIVEGKVCSSELLCIHTICSTMQ